MSVKIDCEICMVLMYFFIYVIFQREMLISVL